MKLRSLRELLGDEAPSIASLVSKTEKAGGEVLIRAGSSRPGLFLLLEGSASVRLEKPGGSDEVARISPGEILGEISLVTGDPTTATVVCDQPSVVESLSAAAFDEATAQLIAP